MKTKVKYLSAILAVMMLFLCVSPVGVSAAEPDTGSAVTGDNSVPVKVSAEPVQFSVTLPTGLPITKDASGNHVCATDVKIVNESVGPVEVTSVGIQGSNGWSIVPWGTDMQSEKVGTKKLAMTLNGDQTGEGKLNFTNANWSVIKGKSSLQLTYQANTPAQGTAVSSQVANVVFTVGWYGNPPTKPETVIPADKFIQPGCTYTPVGGETLVAGQIMPDVVKDGDIFTTEDYEYHYNQHATPEGIWYDNTKQGGWGVRVKDTTKDAYKPLLSSINGYGVVTLACTFMDCKSMTDAPSIPDSAYSIWKTFSGCSSLKNLPHNGSGYIPKGVKGMAYAFENCASLYNAPEIPYGVNNTEGAFLNCTALERAPEIPKSVAFASSTFSGCTSLKGDVVINASNPIQIVDYFKDCAQDSAHTILLKGSCPKLAELKATGYNNGQYIFIPEIVPEGCTYSPNGGEVIPAGGYMPLEVTDNDKFFSEDYVYYYRADKNGWHALVKDFSDKTEFEPLREKINGQSLVDLTSTFAKCSNLITAPEIPNGVVTMDNTFWGCSSLVTAPRIPKGVMSMYRTFWDCTSLSELPSLVSFIPDSVENLDSTFLNCSSLESAPLLPDNVTSLSGTYEGCTALTEAGRLPLNVETLTDVFKGCISLVNPPRIPDGVQYMDNVFEGCTALGTAPRLPNGVQDISRLFKGCISLSSAPEIPASVRSMRETFSGCTSLRGFVTINIQYPYADYLDSFKDCAQDAEHTLYIKGACSQSDKEVIKRTAYNNGQYVTIW